MVYTESRSECSECNSDIGDEEDVFCAGCHETLRNDNDQYEEENDELKEQIKELNQYIDDLENDADNPSKRK